jgi:predicted nuclease of predicted toxin-antitoxin system
LAQWLRAEGHDAVHANELSMYQSPDLEILQSAAGTGRVIITADLDFPRLLASLGSTGPGRAAGTTARPRAGIVCGAC